MKNRPEETDREVESLREDFLDHFCAPLVGVVPYAERAVLRREIDAHLHALTTEYEWSGQTSTEAVHSALREMGEPWSAGAEWLAEWSVGQTVLASTRFARTTLARPFAFFGTATMVCSLLLEQYVLTPNGSGFLPLVVLVAALSPVVAGALTGSTRGTLPVRSLVSVVLGLSLYSLLAGLLLLPKCEGLYFAAFQVGFWLPVGVAVCGLTNTLVRSRHRRRFLRAIP